MSVSLQKQERAQKGEEGEGRKGEGGRERERERKGREGAGEGNPARCAEERKRKGVNGWEAVFIYPEEQPSTSLFGWLISGRSLALYVSGLLRMCRPV
jgi:hypothetical protein